MSDDCPHPQIEINIPNTRQILRTTTTHKNHTMLLQIVSLSLNVRHGLLASGKLYTSHLPLRRVGFLGLHNEDLGYNALALRTILEQRCIYLETFLGLWFIAHGLVECA